MTHLRIWTAVVVVIISLSLSACKSTKNTKPSTNSTKEDAGRGQHRLTPETISQSQQLASTKWWEIEKLPEISAATTRVFGKQIHAFRECDTGNAKVDGNLLIIDAHKPHDGYDGTVFTIDLNTGDAAGALYSEKGTTIFIGDYPSRTNVHRMIEDMLRDDGYAPRPFAYDSFPSEATDDQTARTSGPDAAMAEVIQKSSQFGICRVRELEFARNPSVDSRTCCADSSDVESQNDSLYRYRPVLVLLHKAGYIVGGTTKLGGGSPASDGLGGMVSDSMVPTDIFWLPSKKGMEAIGTDIREGEGGHYQNGWAVHKWTLVLGCRKVQQVDSTTPLADGLKVDFSWRWKPTDLGIADGLTDERQRGVAYLTRSAGGLALDHIQSGSETGR